jgi:hypothetical protein
MGAMNEDRSIDKLSSFYKKLDGIPTPPLTPKTPLFWSIWYMVVAPLGASLVAFAFMSVCASGPADPHAIVPIRIPTDRFAVEELRRESAPQKTILHVSKGVQGRSVI